MRIDRREFLAGAAAMGAFGLWAGRARASALRWREARNLYPEGVASGDPDPHSVILWTRRPFADRESAEILAEVALDPDFRRVVATGKVRVLRDSDWTCRLLVGGLRPATVYWYRFPTRTAMEVGSVARSRRRAKPTAAPSASPSSPATASTRAPRTPTGG